MKTIRVMLSAIAAAGLLAACAETPSYNSSASGYPAQASRSYPVQYGVVERIEVVPKSGGSGVAGTVIGGIVGGLIGRQIGSGTGQTAATIAGAAGGALAGGAIERRRAANETFRVTVRMGNGGYRTVLQDDIVDLRTGDRVRIDGERVSRY